MTTDNTGTKPEVSFSADVVELLSTERSISAYLRAAMLECGDSPELIARALSNVERARASLKRKEPLRVTATLLEINRRTAKRTL
jgi:DNA-binding phage protein